MGYLFLLVLISVASFGQIPKSGMSSGGGGNTSGMSPTPASVVAGVTTEVTVALNGVLPITSTAQPVCYSNASEPEWFDVGSAKINSSRTALVLSFSPSAPYTGICTALVTGVGLKGDKGDTGEPGASHTQNTDTGTSSTTFQIGGASACKWSYEDGGYVLRNATGNGYCDLTVGAFRSNAAVSKINLTCAALPASPAVSDVVCDSDDGNKWKYYTGSAWQVFYRSGSAIAVTDLPSGADIGTKFTGSGGYLKRDGSSGDPGGVPATAGSYYLLSANGTFHGYQGSNTMGSANAVYTLRFHLPFPMDVADFSIQIGTASAGNYFYWGIYSSDGATRHINCSATTDATGIKTCVQSPAVSLPAGWYQYAFGASGVYAGCTVQNVSANTSHLNSGTVQLGVGSTTISGGSLPNTLGTIATAAEEPCNAKLQQ